MNAEKFSRIKNQSLEIQSLIRQGVRQGVSELIDERNLLLQQWFAEMNELINLTNEQQLFLETLLRDEQLLLNELEQEQTDIGKQARGRRPAESIYPHCRSIIFSLPAFVSGGGFSVMSVLRLFVFVP